MNSTRYWYVSSKQRSTLIRQSLVVSVSFVNTKHVLAYLAHYVWVVVGDEAEAPGPARLLVVHHYSVLNLAVPGKKKIVPGSTTNNRRGTKEAFVTNRYVSPFRMLTKVVLPPLFVMGYLYMYLWYYICVPAARKCIFKNMNRIRPQLTQHALQHGEKLLTHVAKYARKSASFTSWSRPPTKICSRKKQPHRHGNKRQRTRERSNE